MSFYGYLQDAYYSKHHVDINLEEIIKEAKKKFGGDEEEVERALLTALSNDKIGLAEALISYCHQKGTLNVNRRNIKDDDRTPLIYTFINRRYELADKLLHVYHADPSLKDKFDKDARWYGTHPKPGAKEVQAKVVKKFLEILGEAIPRELEEKKDDTKLTAEALDGIFAKQAKNNAPPLPVPQKMAAKYTTFAKFLKGKYYDARAAEIDIPRMINEFMGEPGEIEQSDIEEALFACFSDDKLNLMNALIIYLDDHETFTLDPNLKNKNDGNKTLLMYALIYRRYDLARKLWQERGADITLKDDAGKDAKWYGTHPRPGRATLRTEIVQKTIDFLNEEFPGKTTPHEIFPEHLKVYEKTKMLTADEVDNPPKENEEDEAPVVPPPSKKIKILNDSPAPAPIEPEEQPQALVIEKSEEVKMHLEPVLEVDDIFKIIETNGLYAGMYITELPALDVFFESVDISCYEPNPVVVTPPVVPAPQVEIRPNPVASVPPPRVEPLPAPKPKPNAVYVDIFQMVSKSKDTGTDLDALQKNIKLKPECVNDVNSDKISILYYAIINEKYEAARILVENGAPPNQLPHPDNKDIYSQYQLTPLMLAAKAGLIQLVHALIKKNASLDVTNKKGGTALHVAAGNGRVAVVNLLLNCGADHSIKNLRKLTALELAKETARNEKGVLMQNACQAAATAIENHIRSKQAPGNLVVHARNMAAASVAKPAVSTNSSATKINLFNG